MRKLLIIALGFVGLGLVTEPAAAKSVTVSKGSYSSGELQKACAIEGGDFTKEYWGGYSCVNSGTGLATNCSASGRCSNVCNSSKCGNTDPRAIRNRVGNLGGVANTSNPGGVAGPGTTGGTTSAPRPPTAVGTSGASSDGPVVRDHRHGANAPAAPPRGVSTAIPRTPATAAKIAPIAAVKTISKAAPTAAGGSNGRKPN